jgi:hypothetical protein
MRNSSILWTGALALLLAVMAVAADINGKWKADFTSPDGTARTNTFTFKADGGKDFTSPDGTARTNTFTFKVDGGKLTGTVAGSQDETQIQNGKIDGDDISFTAERPFGKFTYSGKAGGNEIKFKVTFNDQSFEMTAKRLAN